jgi:hypothetical protein
MFNHNLNGLAVALAASIAVAACSPGLDTMRVDNRASKLEGQSADALRQCMGEPQSVRQTETGEVWRYLKERVEHRDAYDMYGGSPGMIFRMPASTDRRTCVADVVVNDNVVKSITFSGDSGGGLNRRWACLPLMEKCQ